MSISDELMLAILSMDAYNRGYGAGIEDPNAVGGGLGVSTPTQDYFIGTAKIADSKGDAEAEAAGFYAAAYEWNGETVIAAPVGPAAILAACRWTDAPEPGGCDF